MAHQLAQKTVYGFVTHGIVVIQRQDHACRQSLKLIAERDHQRRLSCRVWRAAQREGLGARFGEHRTDRGNEVTQENHQVAVALIQREPRRWCGRALDRGQALDPRADRSVVLPKPAEAQTRVNGPCCRLRFNCSIRRGRSTQSHGTRRPVSWWTTGVNLGQAYNPHFSIVRLTGKYQSDLFARLFSPFLGDLARTLRRWRS